MGGRINRTSHNRLQRTVSCAARHTEAQPNGRIRHWGYIAEMEKYLRVVTEPDGETVQNAFFDRRFKP